ncbi:MAG: ribosome silencing factor [Chloroflexota bacterium]|jgi:ribosome-associated protein
MSRDLQVKGTAIPIDSKQKAIEAHQASLDKKAVDPVILELKGLTIIADYFVICSGESTTQVRAIVEHIEEKFREKGLKPLRIEGLGFSHWVLMDYGDVVVHVFEAETRAYYELEKLWLDAPRLVISDETQAGLGRQDKRAFTH